jgi:hypothetical protein
MRWPEYRLLLFLIFIAVCTLSCSASDAPHPRYQELDQQDKDLYEDASQRIAIWITGLRIPVGRMLLVRKNNNLCALRFTKVFHEGSYQKPSSVAYYADYEWFYSDEGGGRLGNSKLKSGRGRLDEKHTGYGHPFDVSANNVIECGSFRLGWNPPSTVWFHIGVDSKGDVGNELAPTKWTDIADVNSNDPRLRWYKYGQIRDELFIPIDQLW